MIWWHLNYGGYKMNFELISATNEYLSNDSLKEFDYFVEVDIGKRYSELFDWMVENIGEVQKDWYCEVEHYQYSDHNGEVEQHELIYFWLKKEDAMAFKLRWT